MSFREEIKQQAQKTQLIPNKFINDELALQDLDDVLSKTIYEDKETKTILFLTSLLTYTDEEQRNAVLTGESSIGKTHNLTEILWFFRKAQDQNSNGIIEISDASPRSFIHQANVVTVDERTMKPIDMSKQPKQGDPKVIWDEWHELMRNSAYFLDLSNKIVVFLDIPNFKLLESLRSLLSHDRKICKYLITDKNSKGMNKTKTVLIQGYFTALFASAYSSIEDQETSRNFLLSPSDNSDKIRSAIDMQARKKTDPDFKQWYESEPCRLALKNRISIIESAKIKNVLFKKEDMESLKDWFFRNTENLSPKAQRDFPRLYALAEAWAILNFNHRERTSDNACIYANITDIEAAKKIYEPILKCNELGLTPEEYEVWKIIQPHCDDTMGLRISEIHNLYRYEKKRPCSDKRLRGMLKNFCGSGLLKEEKEGQIIKYSAITHKATAQSQLAPQENESLKTDTVNSL